MFCLYWLYVIIMSCTSFRVNPNSIVCRNVKELLARSRCHIWSLSHRNEIRTQSCLVGKRTLNHLAKLAFWLNGWVFVYEISGSGFESRCCYLPLLIIRNDYSCKLVILLLAPLPWNIQIKGQEANCDSMNAFIKTLINRDDC